MDDRVDRFLYELNVFLRELDIRGELIEEDRRGDLIEEDRRGELIEEDRRGDLIEEDKVESMDSEYKIVTGEPNISLLDVDGSINGIFILFEMNKYMYKYRYMDGSNLYDVWLVFQRDVIKYIRLRSNTSHKEILDAISKVIYMTKIRKTVDYIGNNLFDALIHGVTEDNAPSVVKKAYVGFLGNVNPKLLRSVYLWRTLKDNGFISELDFAVESYISKPVPRFEELLKVFKSVTNHHNLNNLDISTLENIVLTYDDTPLIRSVCSKYYVVERKRESKNNASVERALKESGQWEQMFDVRYDKDSSSDSEY
jgi:hypothetical protein